MNVSLILIIFLLIPLDYISQLKDSMGFTFDIVGVLNEKEVNKRKFESIFLSKSRECNCPDLGAKYPKTYFIEYKILDTILTLSETIRVYYISEIENRKETQSLKYLVKSIYDSSIQKNTYFVARTLRINNFYIVNDEGFNSKNRFEVSQKGFSSEILYKISYSTLFNKVLFKLGLINEMTFYKRLKCLDYNKMEFVK